MNNNGATTPAPAVAPTGKEDRVADPEQFALATRLAEELQQAGHDNIHPLDVLDCLGTAGLQLAQGDDAIVITNHLSLVEDSEQPPRG
jgi:hypothetical protein